MMEKREIAFETGGPKCTISIDNSKVVISIGSDELIATKPITNCGETPVDFFDRFFEAITCKED